MATYGIDFPFRDSAIGNYLRMTSTPEKEVRADLLHLILTKKGSRFLMPDFGTRIYEFIFNQNDTITYNLIEEDIREGVRKYIPNLDIKSIDIVSAEDDTDTNMPSISEDEDNRLFRVSSESTKPYTARIKINYSINSGSFSVSDFIIINI